MKSNPLHARSTKEYGQGFAEYALLLAFVAIATILVVSAVNAVIENQFIDINKCMQNRGARALTSSSCEVAEGTTDSSDGSTDSGETDGSTDSGDTNMTPIANFTYSCTNLACTFTSTSTDSDGTIASYAWDFTTNGSIDNTTANPSNTFASAGTYSVRLTVTDNEGASRGASKSVIVSASGGSSSGGGGNVAPVAAFTEICAGLVCNFTNTSTDSDGTITTYAWDFTNNGSIDSSIASPSNTFPSGGSYTVKLTVIDNGVLSTSITKTVTVSTGANVAPVANFEFSCTGLTCSFTDTSTDDGSISSYAWDFTNDGPTDSTAENPNHTYSAAGTYTVLLKVTDSGGLDNSITKTFTVTTTANTAPTASFTSSCTNLACTFTNTSTDPQGNGTITGYAWDFTSDGTNDIFTANSSNTFASANTYSVKLTVTDSGGLSHTVTNSVTVTSATTYAITDVDVNGSVASNGKLTLNGIIVTVRNNSGTALSGVIVTLSGGVTCTTSAIGQCTLDVADTTINKNASQAYSISSVTGGTGTYTAANNANTDGDANTINSTTITIVNSQANTLPTASFTQVCTNLTCAFSNNSTDPDGTIASSSWAFGDTTTSTSASPSKTYSAAGTYSVVLTVTDNDGGTATVTNSVTVVAPANTAPTASFTSSCTGLTCTFTNTSTDPQGNGTITGYAWDFTNDGTNDIFTANSSNTFASAGTYSVKLTVTDNGGLTGTVTTSVTVTTAPVATYAITDVDAIGTIVSNKLNLTGISIGVFNSSNVAVVGVTVVLQVSSTNYSCTTVVGGYCTVDVPDREINNTSVPYTIISVTGGTGTYTASNNTNNDGTDPHLANSTTVTIVE